MDRVLGLFDKLLRPRYEEDFVDRLNYRVTGLILLGAAITMITKEYVGNPLQCWTPAQFQDGWVQYVEDYCFVENTYWVRFNDSIPSDHTERDRLELSYYQWVPFVLALQALMFNIPHVIWRMLNWLSGIEVRAVITMASKPNGLGMDKMEATAEMIARHLKAGLQMSDRDSLSTSSNPFAWIARWTSAFVGAYITMTYLFVKLLFIVNCVLQFVLLNAFLGTQYQFWGIGILHDLLIGADWFDTGHFPRVTLCDFAVRSLGNLHRWTVQCVLVMNMFSEKIYLFLWWWLLLVTIVTILNFFHWLFISMFRSLRAQFLEQMLNANRIYITDANRDAFDRFVDKVVRSDGVVVLRLMARNAGEIVGSNVVTDLWKISRDELHDNNIHSGSLRRPQQRVSSADEDDDIDGRRTDENAPLKFR